MNERAKQIEKLAPEETKVIQGTEENLKKKSVKEILRRMWEDTMPLKQEQDAILKGTNKKEVLEIKIWLRKEIFSRDFGNKDKELSQKVK